MHLVSSDTITEMVTKEVTIPPEWTAKLDKLSIAVGGNLTIDLNDYFTSNTELTYLVTAANEDFDVEIIWSKLIIESLINESSKGFITIVASDMENSVRKELIIESEFIDKVEQEVLNSPVKLDKEVVESLEVAGEVEILVTLEDKTDLTKDLKLEEDLEDYDYSKFNDYSGFNVVSMKITRQGLDKLKKNKNIIGIFENEQFVINIQNSIPLIKADKVHNENITGYSKGVCVLDTGVDLDHPKLSDSIVGGYDFVNNDAIPEDDNNHGTHVAGIIKATAPNCSSS